MSYYLDSPFDYFVVVDFEATCWNTRVQYQKEIIEFPAIFVDANQHQYHQEFHEFVRPTECSVLSRFCQQLTGLSQEHVDNSPRLGQVLPKFVRWIKEMESMHDFTMDLSQYEDEPVGAMVTWSDNDLGQFLDEETRRKRVPKPRFLNAWINLQTVYKDFKRRRDMCSLEDALRMENVRISGQPHEGISDARNTARLLKRLLKQGCPMGITTVTRNAYVPCELCYKKYV